jgi:S-adenosyl-L-methionine hydrolase (adenosine-forming)
VRPVVTFTTDFGTRDSFVGTMKGVVLTRCPDAQLVDICHEVPPQDVRVGALRIAAAAPYFPPGTVHVVVVDPGVGTMRRPIAIAAGSQLFVGPDNGVLALAAPPAADGWHAVHLTKSERWLPTVSTTFHGRDVFSPVAGFLAAGGQLADVGDPIDSIVPLDLPQISASGDGLEGVVLDVDRFGNLTTNVRGVDLVGHPVASIGVGSAHIGEIGETYDPSRRLVALINSEGWLEIAAPLGNAAELLGVTIGEPIRVRFSAQHGIGPESGSQP